MYIADIGSNFVAGNKEKFQRAMKLIQRAATNGATHVKFHLIDPSQLYRDEKDKKMYSRFSFPESWVPQLAEECKENKVGFLCVPHYQVAVDILDEYVDAHCVSAWELADETWENDLLKHIADSGKDIIMYTAGATLKEIDHNLSYMFPDISAKEMPVTLMHEDVMFPTPPALANLRKILDIATEFHPLFVGYASKVMQPQVVAASVLYTSVVTEVCFDLGDKEGAEFGHSYEPAQFAEMVKMANLFKKAMVNQDDNYGQNAVNRYRRNPKDRLRPYERK